MSEDESGRGGPFADDESAADVFGEDLWTEVKEVCSQARRQTETARVSLDIEKGLLLIAQYLVAHEQFEGDWQRLQTALESKGKDGRSARTAVHDRLAGYLQDALRTELDALAQGHHPILRTAAERRGWRREKPKPDS